MWELFTVDWMPRVEWSRELSSDAYCELLCTYSDHLTLPSAERDRLF
jgi:hypothetical protein